MSREGPNPTSPLACDYCTKMPVAHISAAQRASALLGRGIGGRRRAQEHRGDGHVDVRIGGSEAHVLDVLAQGIHPPESFGHFHHLPQERLAAVMDGSRERGSSTPTAGWPMLAARPSDATKPLTDELAAPLYDALTPAELEPITATPVATGSQ